MKRSNTALQSKMSESRWLNGHEFEWIPRDSEGKEGWCVAVHGVTKSRPRLSNWTTDEVEETEGCCFQACFRGFRGQECGRLHLEDGQQL